MPKYQTILPLVITNRIKSVEPYIITRFIVNTQGEEIQKDTLKVPPVVYSADTLDELAVIMHGEVDKIIKAAKQLDATLGEANVSFQEGNLIIQFMQDSPNIVSKFIKVVLGK